MEPISYRQEIFRKLIHLSSLWMVVAMALMERDLAIRFFWGLTAAVLIIERSRHSNRYLNAAYNALFRRILRDHETQPGRLSGGAFVLLSAAFALVFFPLHIAMTAFSFMILGDTAAALVGRRWGRRRILDKSLEGCAAFVVACLPVIAVIGPAYGLASSYYIAAVAAALAGAAVELIAKRLRLDDNLLITISCGCVMLLVSSAL